MKTDDLFGEQPTPQPIAREPTGAELRDEAIARALDAAERKNPPEWGARALERLRLYALAHEYLTTERVRLAAEAEGFPLPKTARSWGAIPVMAARRGYIADTGRSEKAKNPKAHKAPKGIWRSLIWQGNA